MSTLDVRVAVLGGGITGLCTAHYLAQAFGNDAIAVIEAADSVGGTARTDRVDGFTCDWGPNGFLDREPKTLEWIASLGLIDRMVQADESAARRFILKDDALHEILPPPRFFLSPLLSLSGRLRLLREPFVAAKRDHTGETIWQFAARRIGPEAADILVSSMVRGIFAGDAKVLALESCFPRMAEMERMYGGLTKAMLKRRRTATGGPSGPRGTLTSCTGGIGLVAERSAERLGSAIHCGTRATVLRRDQGVYRIDTDHGLTITAQHVVIAVPAFAAAHALSAFDDALARALAAIPYAGVAVVSTGYPREHVNGNVNGFGFLVPPNQHKRVLGCLWTSSIFPGQAPEGAVLLRTMLGGYNDPDAVSLSDRDLLAHVAQDIHPLLGITAQPSFARIFRHAQGIPQYVLGHSERVAAIEAAEARHPGLHFAGNAYRGVGINDCVLSAHRVINRVVES